MGTKIRDLTDTATSIDDNDFLVLASSDNKTKKISGANFKSSVGGASFGGAAGIKALRLTGSPHDAGSGDVFDSLAPNQGTPAEPGIYCISPIGLSFFSGPYDTSQSYAAIQDGFGVSYLVNPQASQAGLGRYSTNGMYYLLACPDGQDTSSRVMWSRSEGRPPEISGLVWKDGRLQIYHRARPFFMRSYDVTVFYLPF